MRIAKLLMGLTLLLGGCARRDGPDAGSGGPLANHSGATTAAAGWSLESNGDGVVLVLTDQAGSAAIRLICPKGRNHMLVNVPSFTPIASEERLSFGGKGSVLTLVADPTGDEALGGVTGAGPIPDELKAVIIEPMSASYGAQQSGPHPAVPDRLGGPFLTACGEALTAARIAETKPTASTSPCHVQDGHVLNISPIEAVGTEPFWTARIDGRCVTYATPEDQKGTRIWTQIGNGPMGGIWVGTYKGKPFRLIPFPVPSCSDGMSDKAYSMRVDLLVEGEQRNGCAEPFKQANAPNV